MEIDNDTMKFWDPDTEEWVGAMKEIGHRTSVNQKVVNFLGAWKVIKKVKKAANKGDGKVSSVLPVKRKWGDTTAQNNTVALSTVPIKKPGKIIMNVQVELSL